jgi:hypothetical protein
MSEQKPVLRRDAISTARYRQHEGHPGGEEGRGVRAADACPLIPCDRSPLPQRWQSMRILDVALVILAPQDRCYVLLILATDKVEYRILLHIRCLRSSQGSPPSGLTFHRHLMLLLPFTYISLRIGMNPPLLSRQGYTGCCKIMHVAL